MDEYSIESRSEKIFNSKTKEYFLEVLSSYRQGNFRSATVMLWSVAICDLLYKLKYMNDMYGDTIAKGILEEVEKIQTKKPRSSEWEFKLVELISTRTNLLEIQDVDHLSHLQQQRHLAAHPVLSAEMELHRPNKETVRALIRNTIDGILSKPAIYTRKVFEEFINDLDASSAVLIKDETLKSYIESKYLSHSDKKLEHELIRSMWKFVFRLSNPDCDRNRNINYRSIKLLVDRNALDTVNLVRADSAYFSNIAPLGEPILYLVYLLSRHPQIYDELTQAAKVIVTHTIDNNSKAKCMGWFVKPSLEDHCNSLISWLESSPYPEIPEDTIQPLTTLSDSPEWNNFCKLIFNAYYGSSKNYDTADSRFLLSIKPFLNDYNADALTDLLSKIESASQTFERRRARHDHREIKEKCDIVLGVGFDYTPYPNFLRSIT